MHPIAVSRLSSLALLTVAGCAGAARGPQGGPTEAHAKRAQVSPDLAIYGYLRMRHAVSKEAPRVLICDAAAVADVGRLKSGVMNEIHAASSVETAKPCDIGGALDASTDGSVVLIERTTRVDGAIVVYARVRRRGLWPNGWSEDYRDDGLGDQRIIVWNLPVVNN